MKKAMSFIKAARRKGYKLEGSIFKVDYNGEMFNVGFWFRPNLWNDRLNEYELKGMRGSAKHKVLSKAIELAIKEATKN